jgi:hypothetical protein
MTAGFSKVVPHAILQTNNVHFKTLLFADHLIPNYLWPVKPPDLASSDIYLWGYLKRVV